MPSTLKKEIKSPRRRNGEATFQAILDAAEELFTKQGFNGTSLREVAKLAGAPLGVLSYHVGSKDELFRSVMSRRAPEHVALVTQRLKTLDLTCESPDTALQKIIRAYLTTSTEWFMRGSRGQKFYIQLIAQAMSLPYFDKHLISTIEAYDPLIADLKNMIIEIYPVARIHGLNWAIYFMQAIFIHLTTQSQIAERHSDGLCTPSDLDAVLDELVPFLAAGFRELLRVHSEKQG